jgi:hypothetical protein
VAVGAQEPQVLDAVVAPVAVDVIDLQRERMPSPERFRPASGAPLLHAHGCHRPLEPIAGDAPGLADGLLDE